LLRDASLVNYQGGQSLLNFDPCPTCVTGAEGAGISGPTSGQGLPPQVPGYEILESLGRGGMGAVYKARDVNLNRLVALKVLPAGAVPEALTRFRREAEVVARLRHPNIVQIYGLFAHQGFQYLALEYVGGGDLARKMREGLGQGGPMPVRTAVEMLATVARAVESAHLS